MTTKKGLPKGWEIKPLGEICRIIKGKKPQVIFEKETQGSLPYVIIDSFSNGHKNYTKDKNSPICDPKDVLMVMDGARSGLIAKGLSGVIGSTLATIRPTDESELDPNYLYFFLGSQYSLINTRTSGSTIPHTDKKLLKRLPIPVPPLKVQKKIVSILERADSLKQKRRQANENTDKLLQSVFVEMFGDPKKASKWPVMQLKEVLRDTKGALQSGPFGSDLHNSDFITDGKVLAIGIDNVFDEGLQLGRERRISYQKYEELSKFKLCPGDVLITIMGTVGRTCVFPSWAGDAICTKHVYRIQVDQKEIKPEYLCAYLQFSDLARKHLQTSITGQIVSGITSKSLRELKIVLPPIEYQSEFIRVMKKIKDLKDGQKQASEEVDKLFKVLIQQAFSGDLKC